MLEQFISLALLSAAAGIALWMAGALYFDVSQSAWWAKGLAAAWLMGVAATFLLWQPTWKPFLALLGILAVFLAWWFRQQPSNDREWDVSVAILPQVIIEGDAVRIENVRNFDYPSATEFQLRYETRTVHLANLVGVDIIFFNWGSPWMSHPVLVFDFGPDGRICISIEVRYRKGQGFAMLRSFYRQQELIFLVGDERDMILRRTKFGKPHDARLYKFHAKLDEIRTTFLDYMGQINQLNMQPRWYHGLFANCTTTFYRLPNSRYRVDWRVLVNGHLDRALYEDHRFDHSLPFEELHRFARINEIANAAPELGFGDYLRRELENRRHGP